MRRVSLVAALGVLAGACGSREPPAPRATGQVVVWLDTDAPLPRATPASPFEPIPLFDRVRIDVARADGAPCDCTREFDVTDDSMRAGISFGVVPPALGGATARVRLFRASVTIDGAPSPDSTIDVTAALPPQPPDGTLVDLTVMLPTDSAGAAVGASAPIDPTPGRPDGSQAGSWARAARAPCPGAPRPGEVCIPGGAYWMGDPSVAGWTVTATGRQRLVALSPFFLDEKEVTVGSLRAAGLAADRAWSGRTNGASDDYCTFTPSPGPRESLPVDCVDWNVARAYCRSRGADLPTEAQFEYVAGGLRGAPYAWGIDTPRCGDAAFERAGVGSFANFPGTCRTDAFGGPALAGSGALDRVVLPGGTVVDVDGNLVEWMLDSYNADDQPCWSRLGVYVDPLCVAKSDAASARGGSWLYPAGLLRAGLRDWGTKSAWEPFVGFRCARAANGS